MVEISNPETSPEQTDPITAAVEFRNVSFSYDDKRVLNDLSFKLAQGEIKIILSGSGGGKTTILKLILGLSKPDTGQILVGSPKIVLFDEPTVGLDRRPEQSVI